MNQKDLVSPRQLLAAAFVAILSPLIRRFPRVLAETAGRAAWLSVGMTVLPAAAAAGMLWLFYRRQPLGSGFADILTRCLGKWPGRILTGFYGLWFAMYAGFLLRSGADRFISTVYPGSGPALFVVVMALLCLVAAMGRLCPIARAAMLFRPLLCGVFLAVFLLTMRDFRPQLLFPVTKADLAPGMLASLQTTNVLSVGTLVVFFTDQLSRPFRREDRPFLQVLALLGLILLMTVSCLAMFGPRLTANMSYPFFMLVRDLSVLGSLERAEPVVIALWVLSDFVMLSLLLQGAGKNIRFCLGFRDCRTASPALCLRQGRWLFPLCGVLAAAGAILLPGDISVFRLLSEKLVPTANWLFSCVLPILVLVIGLLRKRL